MPFPACSMQRARPPGIFVTQPALSVHVPVFVCSLHEGWCSRAQTPTSCCVNPAPPVAQSGTAPAIHTSSVGKSLLGLTKPFYISHTPSHNQTTIASFIRSQRHHIGPIRVLYHSTYTRLWKHSTEIKHHMEKHYSRVLGVQSELKQTGKVAGLCHDKKT